MYEALARHTKGGQLSFRTAQEGCRLDENVGKLYCQIGSVFRKSSRPFSVHFGTLTFKPLVRAKYSMTVKEDRGCR